VADESPPLPHYAIISCGLVAPYLRAAWPNHILRANPGLRIAIIVNELGAIRHRVPMGHYHDDRRQSAIVSNAAATSAVIVRTWFQFVQLVT
jgi:hypothetical protein